MNTRLTLYTASVPVFRHYLARLAGLLDAAERHCASSGVAPDALLAARLAPDMFSLGQQVAIAIGFTLRATYPLAGMQVPVFDGASDGFAALRRHIDWACAQLDALPADEVTAGETREVRSRAGFAELTLPGEEHLMRYALPNFFFHLSTVYALLRSQGVAIGKPDFDGYHAYPSGFSFPAAVAKGNAKDETSCIS